MFWTKDKNTVAVGQSLEALAEKYLISQGLTSFTKNFHSRQGEIDLIMREQNTWVFVEVKYRKSNQFGGPLAAVSASKQQKIKQCAAFFLQQQQLNEYNTPCRFDVVALLGQQHQPEITWLKNAF
ncbi:YraN family protein [Thalassotalea sp. PLHSN55]|uniref:YraN family protein n=1 Tax=Thalassotalea sp. PLHSN55 TaxID=3435888 RepID=UPI003F837E68